MYGLTTRCDVIKMSHSQNQDEKFLNHLVSIEMTITRLKSLYNALNDMMQDVK